MVKKAVLAKTADVRETIKIQEKECRVVVAVVVVVLSLFTTVDNVGQLQHCSNNKLWGCVCVCGI